MAERLPQRLPRALWVNELEIATSSPWTQWEWSFFITVAQMLSLTQAVTTIRRSVELWGYIASILIGAVFYAVFTAVTTAVVADMDTSARAYRSRLDAINQYMIHSQLPRELRAKLRTYFELRFPGHRSFNEDGILNEISPPLRQEICLHKCRSVLAALQLLDDKSSSKGDKGLPGAISQELQRSVFVTGDYIIREGEETPGLFFVSAGLVELFNDADPSRILTTLGAGSMFGEMALLSQTGRGSRRRHLLRGLPPLQTPFNRLAGTLVQGVLRASRGCGSSAPTTKRRGPSSSPTTCSRCSRRSPRPASSPTWARRCAG